MKNNKAVVQRVEAYLHEVERHLAHKPPAVRHEVVAGLRDHIAEAWRRAAARGEEGLETIEHILAEMDPPETFAEAAAEVAVGGAVMAGQDLNRSRAGRWFALALAFLLVNGYGVWRVTDHLTRMELAGAAAPKTTEKSAPVVKRILRLRKVEQVDVSPERELIVRLTFSDQPDRAQMTRFLTLSVPGQGEVAYQLNRTPEPNVLLLQTRPVLGEKLEYVLEAGLPSASDSQPTDRRKKGSLKMEMNMLLRNVEVESPAFDSLVLRADFTARPEWNEIKEYVTVDPAVAFTVESVNAYWWKGLLVRGDFQPGAIYDITFKEGLPAANGSSLPQTLSRKIQFPPRKKAVRVDSPGRYLAPGGALCVPVLAANLEQYVARLSPVFANNLVQLALRETRRYRYYGKTADDLTGSGSAITNTLAPATDGAPVRSRVELRRLTAGEPRGIYWLEVGEEHARGDGRLLVVTDLGLATRVSEGRVLAWVNRLGSAEPVADAAVTVYARNNQVIARGATDEQGLARMVLPEGETPFVVVAETEGDLTYIDLERTGVAAAAGTGGRAYLQPGQLEAAVFTERGIYRPGENVFVQVLARDDQMRAPAPFPALMRVWRPDGNLFRDITVELDDMGSATCEVTLPDYLPTGRYRFQLAMPGTHTVLGQTAVALEDFVPPQIRVEVESPPGRAAAGDVLTFNAHGEHLFGAPAAGLKVTAMATVAPAPFSPSNWPGWTFGDPEKEFAPIHRKIGAGHLDAEGAGQFVVDTRKAWRPPAALSVVLGATVMESSGRAVTAYGSARVDAYPFYVGLKPSWGRAPRVGVTQRVAVVEVQPDGTPVTADKPLVLTVSRVTWSSVLRRNRVGLYEWKSERQVIEIHQDTLAAGGEPRDWSFAVDAPGEYMLAAVEPASGAAARLTFWVASADPAWAAWSREKPGHIDLSWDRPQFRAGETARLQVRAPFTGRALLTVETDHVHEARVVILEKNTAEIEVPVEALYAPNAWCTLTLIRPATAEAVWSAHRAIGTIALPVEQPQRELRVTIDAPQTTHPQAPLTGSVTVCTSTGAPAAGRVTVMAVDEAICLLTVFQTPDPLQLFTAQRALMSSAYDLYSELMPILEEELVSTPAAGGDGAGALRKRLNPIKANRFKPLALWVADVPLDAEGHADFQMDLPEFSGELRVMAVAFNTTQCGSTSTAVVVRREVVIQPALPRFLALGDRAEASV
ncbi:MAG: MG2 domain-containing protein, partial [Kiritimatiellia bacterium]|nr:MG2 domain-containing protein [Kiritimatiellia bacterium]